MKPTDVTDPEYFHKVVDCQWACPSHTPVPEYIRLIAEGTLVTAWYQPILGGLLALMSPFARMRNVRLLARQLDRAKAFIEAAPSG